MFTPCSPNTVPTRPIMPGMVAVAEQRQVAVVVHLQVEALAPRLEQVRAVAAARASCPTTRVRCSVAVHA